MPHRPFFAALAATLLWTPAVFAANKLVLGYYPSWQRWTYSHTKIGYENLSHIAHAFIWPNADGSLQVPGDFVYPELVQAAHAREIKIIVSLGGWGQSAGFSPMVADTAARHRFVANVTSFCTTNGYDGVDLDWEYPSTSADRANLTALVRELRQAFDRANPSLSLSMAVPVSDWAGRWYDFSAMTNALTWIGTMTYDFHGSWTNHAGHNAPLYASPNNDPQGSVHDGINYLLSRGIPAEKILLGLPFYGWQFNATRLNGISTGASQLPFTRVMEQIAAGWSYHWDNVAKVPYLQNPSQTLLISFDDTVSIWIKCEYAQNRKLGGAMIWALGQDDLGSEQPLLATVGRSLGIITDVSRRPLAEALPKTLTLLPNYPNPFNASTIIRYYIAQHGPVRLDVLNVLGQKVVRLVDETQRPGWYTVNFDSHSLPSGLYFSQLSAQGLIQTRKMALLR